VVPWDSAGTVGIGAVVVVVVAVRRGGVDADGETKVGDAAETHLVDEDVFELDVAVDEEGLLVEIPETADDLAEDHAGVVLEEGG